MSWGARIYWNLHGPSRHGNPWTPETQKVRLGNSENHFPSSRFWAFEAEFLSCPILSKKSGMKTPKVRLTSVNVVFWTFCDNAKTARNCPTRKLRNSDFLSFLVDFPSFWGGFLSFWGGLSEFLILGVFWFSGSRVELVGFQWIRAP